ncbi:MAG TPA: helix-turn-helix domain-containing protein [Candidatus Thermoplasmatota archaeon]
MGDEAGPGGPPAPDPPDLKLENRRRIYGLIREKPGIHLREVVRELEMPYGTAEYHLRVLEAGGLVRAVDEDNYRRYYEADVALRDRRAIGLMRKRPVRAVVIALIERGELSHHDLAAAAGLKPSTLSYHLARMEGAALLRTRQEGRFTMVSIADPALVERLLFTHGRSFGDEAVDRFLDTWAPFEAPPPARPAPSKGPGEAGAGRPAGEDS